MAFPCTPTHGLQRIRSLDVGSPRISPGLRPFGRPARRTTVLAQRSELLDVQTAPREADVQTVALPTRSRKYRSLLPPFFERATLNEQYKEGLWALTQPLDIPVAGDPKLRMLVARLEDGSLWLHNPVAPTEEVVGALEDIGGGVSHIVVPNNSPEHWYFLPGLAKTYPEATVWVPPGFFEGNRVPFPAPGLKALQQTHTIKSYASGSPAEWGGQISLELLKTPNLTEGAFCLHNYRTITFSDTLLKISDAYAPGERSKQIAEQMGCYQKLGPFSKPLFDKFPEETRRWMDAVQKLDFDTIVPSHVAAPIDGRKEFDDCFNVMFPA